MTVNFNSCSRTRLFLFIFVVMLLAQPTTQIVKCNRHLLNEFGLAGIKYAINDKMDICGHVIDKCCSVYDEIRIYKFWNEYTRPIIDTRVHDYMLYTSGIVKQFGKLMAIDPQLIVLKYPVTRQIPYQHESCTKSLKEMSHKEEQALEKYDTTKATFKFAKAFYKQIVNKKKKFNPKKYTHDKHGDRHYGVMPTRTHQIYYKRFGRHGTASVVHEKVDMTDLTCKRLTDNYTKDFVIVNEIKTKYCLGLYKRFLNMDNQYLLRFLPVIKNFLFQNGTVKGGVYCSLCDAHQQEFFNIEKKKVIVKEHFCKSLLHQKKDLFNFMHVFFVEYMDSLLQYTQCFETDGKIFSFPFKNFMEKYKRRIVLVKSCLESTDKKDFMDKCWFVCKNYKFFGVDWFYNGDVALVKRVYLSIFSFLHKLNQEAHEHIRKGGNPDFTVADNVNGMLVEPLNPSYAISKHYYIDDKTRKDLLGKLDTRYKPPPLPKKKKKKVEKKVDKMMKNLGLPSVKKIEKLKKEHKALKKKYSEVKKIHKQIAKFDKVKKFFKKWEKKKRDDKDPKKKKKVELTASGLTNALLKIKKKNKVHDGHYPQRHLLQNKQLVKDVKNALLDYGLPRHLIDVQFEKSHVEARFLKDPETQEEEAEEKIAKENAKEMQKMKDLKDPNAYKINTVMIESASQIFEKNKAPYGVSKFEILWDEDGINPFKSFELIDYKFNITSIIEKKIKEEEKIADSVIQTYLITNPRYVNKFNFDIDSDVFTAGMITNHRFNRYKRIELYAKLNKRVALLGHIQKKIKDIIKRNRRAMHRKQMFKELKRRRKEQKAAKQAAKLNRVVIANNHIDKPHFHDNFHGFKRYFLSIFGD